jgi:hypothetical protein
MLEELKKMQVTDEKFEGNLWDIIEILLEIHVASVAHTIVWATEATWISNRILIRSALTL